MTWVHLESPFLVLRLEIPVGWRGGGRVSYFVALWAR